MDIAKLIDAARERHAAGQDAETIIKFLVDAGADKSDCILIVKRAGVVEKSEAKRVVHYSEAWAHRRAADEELHERLAELSDDD